MMRTASLVVEAFIFCCAAFSVQAQVNTKSLDEKKWVLLESKNFKIYSNVSAKKSDANSETVRKLSCFL